MTILKKQNVVGCDRKDWGGGGVWVSVWLDEGGRGAPRLVSLAGLRALWCGRRAGYLALALAARDYNARARTLVDLQGVNRVVVLQPITP